MTSFLKSFSITPELKNFTTPSFPVTDFCTDNNTVLGKTMVASSLISHKNRKLGKVLLALDF